MAGRIIVLVAVLSAIGCGGSSRPDEFTGKIAFVDGGNRVATLDAADSTVTRIGRGIDTPTWSRDGATLTYSTPDARIVLADVSSGSEKRLARPRCWYPVFAPLGSLIACEVQEPYIIMVADTTDSSVVTRTPDCCSLSTWSPDGRQIAFLSIGIYGEDGRYHGPAGLFVMNADGTNKRRIVKTGADLRFGRPAWSSRGTIAFSHNGGIWAVKPSGKDLHTLMASGAGQNGVAWSPDGSKLVFQKRDGDLEVFVVNADGSGLENLTDNEKISDESPSWSPDGKAIVFVSNREGGVNQIFAMRADGSGQTQLTHAGDVRSACCPAWSPAR